MGYPFRSIIYKPAEEQSLRELVNLLKIGVTYSELSGDHFLIISN